MKLLREWHAVLRASRVWACGQAPCWATSQSYPSRPDPRGRKARDSAGVTVGHGASIRVVLEGSPQPFRWWDQGDDFCLSLAVLHHKPSRPDTP